MSSMRIDWVNKIEVLISALDAAKDMPVASPNAQVQDAVSIDCNVITVLTKDHVPKRDGVFILKVDPVQAALGEGRPGERWDIRGWEQTTETLFKSRRMHADGFECRQVCFQGNGDWFAAWVVSKGTTGSVEAEGIDDDFAFAEDMSALVPQPSLGSEGQHNTSNSTFPDAQEKDADATQLSILSIAMLTNVANDVRVLEEKIALLNTRY